MNPNSLPERPGDLLFPHFLCPRLNHIHRPVLPAHQKVVQHVTLLTQRTKRRLHPFEERTFRVHNRLAVRLLPNPHRRNRPVPAAENLACGIETLFVLHREREIVDIIARLVTHDRRRHHRSVTVAQQHRPVRLLRQIRKFRRHLLPTHLHRKLF